MLGAVALGIGASVVALGIAGASSSERRSGVPLDPGESVCITASGTPGDFAVVNITPVRASGPGFIASRSSERPAGEIETSSANYDVGTTDPNLAIVEIGPDNRICFDNSDESSVDLIVDQAATLEGDAATGVNERLIDTRLNEIDATFAPNPACVEPGESVEIVISNVSQSPLEVSLWGALEDSSGEPIGQVGVMRGSSAFFPIATGATTTIPPVAPTNVPVSESTIVEIKAPPGTGQYTVTGLIVGLDEDLIVKVSSNC